MEDEVIDTTQAMKELIEYRAGEITLSQLADIWAKRKWDTPTPDTTDNFIGLTQPDGTWQEVLRMEAQGQLTPDEYLTILKAVEVQNPK